MDHEPELTCDCGQAVGHVVMRTTDATRAHPRMESTVLACLTTAGVHTAGDAGHPCQYFNEQTLYTGCATGYPYALANFIQVESGHDARLDCLETRKFTGAVLYKCCELSGLALFRWSPFDTVKVVPLSLH
ncbi:hypothetical protein KEM54_005726 [Ascosphaera aggregata]|nr:hypothetical protein KEM54_005726 [Ascosphaera aggregata]